VNSEQHVWQQWKHLSYLMLHFQGTLLNNPVKLVSSESRVPTTCLLLQYQRMHGLLCYRAGKKIHARAWASSRRPPDALPGISSGSHWGTSVPRLLCFTPPNLKSSIRPWTWCVVFHSRVFHPCHLVPRFPFPYFPALLLGAAFSRTAFTVNPFKCPIQFCECHAPSNY